LQPIIDTYTFSVDGHERLVQHAAARKRAVEREVAARVGGALGRHLVEQHVDTTRLQRVRERHGGLVEHPDAVRLAIQGALATYCENLSICSDEPERLVKCKVGGTVATTSTFILIKQKSMSLRGHPM